MRFLYKKIASCSECPYWYDDYDGDRFCHNDDREPEGDMVFEDLNDAIKSFKKCPLPKEFSVELRGIKINQGDLAILKIPESLTDQRDDIVQAASESLQKLNILPSGLFVVNEGGADLRSLPEEEMNKMGWYRKDG